MILLNTNFYIDQAEAFIQEGSPDEPVVYWLQVQAEFHEWPVKIQITKEALWSLHGILKPIVETLYKIHEP